MDYRYQYIIDGVNTPIVVLDTNLDIDYINSASFDALEMHHLDAKKIYPEFDIDNIVGTNLRDIKAVSREAIVKLTQSDRGRYSTFIDVGDDKIHITVYPILGTNDIDQGSAVEWWYATKYLAAQAHAKSISDITDTINKLTFEAKLLSINAEINAAHANDIDNSRSSHDFTMIANEMQNLSGRCREIAKEVYVNILGDLDK